MKIYILKVFLILVVLMGLVFTFKPTTAPPKKIFLSDEKEQQQKLVVQNIREPQWQKNGDLSSNSETIAKHESPNTDQIEHVEEQPESETPVGPFDNPQGNNPVINFSKDTNDNVADVSHIDPIVRENGVKFTANLHYIDDFAKGERFDFNLLGKNFSASVVNKSMSPEGYHFIEVSLSPDSHVAHLTIFYGKNVTRGRIYTGTGSYIYEHNGTTGFLMSLAEYKASKGITEKSLNEVIN